MMACAPIQHLHFVCFQRPVVTERVGRRLVKVAAAYSQICSQKNGTLLWCTHVEVCVNDARTARSGKRYIRLV
jgi:hypothetical protein